MQAVAVARKPMRLLFGIPVNASNGILDMLHRSRYQVINVEQAKVNSDVDPKVLTSEAAYRAALKVEAILDAGEPYDPVRTAVIGIAQAISFRGFNLRKPKSAGEARSLLRAYANNYLTVITTAYARRIHSGKSHSETARMNLYFEEFSDKDIESILFKDFWRLYPGCISLDKEPFSTKLRYVEMHGGSLNELPSNVIRTCLQRLRISLL